MAYVVKHTYVHPQPTVVFADGAQDIALFDFGTGPVRLLTPEQVPEVAYLKSSHGVLPELISISAKLGVAPRVKDVVEALEPGRHQFFPVFIKRLRGSKPILDKDGASLRAPYYLINIGVRLDAVWIEKSDVTVKQITPSEVFVSEKGGREEQIVLRRSIVEGHHIWRGNRHLSQKIFFSDALFQVAQQQKWKGRDFWHIREE